MNKTIAFFLVLCLVAVQATPGLLPLGGIDDVGGAGAGAGSGGNGGGAGAGAGSGGGGAGAGAGAGGGGAGAGAGSGGDGGFLSGILPGVGLGLGVA